MPITPSLNELAEAIYLANAEVPDPQDGIAPAKDPEVKLEAFDDLEEETQTGFFIMANALLARFDITEKQPAGDYEGRPIEQDLDQIMMDPDVKRIWLHPEAFKRLKNSKYFDHAPQAALPDIECKGSYLGVRIYEKPTMLHQAVAEYSHEKKDGRTPVRRSAILNHTFPLKVTP